MDASKSIVANIGFVDDGIIIDNDAPAPSAVVSNNSITRDDIANMFGRNVYKLFVAAGSAMRYTPNLAGAEGEYEFYVWYPANGPTSVPYYIHHDGGVDTVVVDQSANGAAWYLVGTYSFSNGDYVEIFGEDCSGRPYADAVRFLSTGPTDVKLSAAVSVDRPLACRAATVNGTRALDITGPSGSNITVELFTVSGRLVARTRCRLIGHRVMLALPSVARGTLMARVRAVAGNVKRTLRTRIAGL
jgi:hypothetical protein